MANSSYTGLRLFDSSYFLNSIPADVIPTVITSSSIDATAFSGSGDYEWYEYDGAVNGDLTIATPINFGSRKVILIVKNANLIIGGDITFTKGSGFFMSIAAKDINGLKGNIIVDPAVGGGGVPNLDGIYIADGQFQTGTGGASADSQLTVRGAVTGYNGIILQRDMGGPANQTTPAEVFEYDPSMELLFPPSLLYRSLNWKEVAP